MKINYKTDHQLHENGSEWKSVQNQDYKLYMREKRQKVENI